MKCSFEPAPYASRDPKGLGLWCERGWRIKQYFIGKPSCEYNASAFAVGWEKATKILPEPAAVPARPGVGFSIFHQGEGVRYIVLCWWENENELVTHVIVDVDGAADDWRSGGVEYSFCVWDLEVIGWERDLYVEEVLNIARQSDLDRYVARFRNQEKLK